MSWRSVLSQLKKHCGSYLGSCAENNIVCYEITEQPNVCLSSSTVMAVSILSVLFKAEKHLKCRCSNSLKVTWAEDSLFMLVLCRHPTLYWTARWPISIHGWLRWREEGASCTSLRLWKISWLLKCYIWQERKCSWSSWKPHSAGQQYSWRYVEQALEFACSILLQFKSCHVKYKVRIRIQLSFWGCQSLLCRVQAVLQLNMHVFRVFFYLFKIPESPFVRIWAIKCLTTL